MRDRGSRVGEGRRGGSSEGRAQPERGIIVKITYGPTSFMHAEEEESFGGGGGEKIARYSFLCRLLIISQLGRRDCLCSRFSLSLSFFFFFFFSSVETFSDRKTTGKRDKDVDDVRTRCFMRRGNARLFGESVSPLDSSAKEIAERLGDGTREEKEKWEKKEGKESVRWRWGGM